MEKNGHKCQNMDEIWWSSVNLFLAVDVFITKSTNHYNGFTATNFLSAPQNRTVFPPFEAQYRNSDMLSIKKQAPHTPTILVFWSTQYFQHRQ